MYFLSPPLVDLAMSQFDALPPHDPPKEDCFFQTFTPGNARYATDHPFERFCDYEEILLRLHGRNPRKYEAIHKGTPFYFLAWLAFDLRNFEKGLFYLDAAISEDVRVDPANWFNRPAAQFLKLQADGHSAQRTIKETRELLSERLDHFNSISTRPSIRVGEFVTRFVDRLIRTSETRTIISAFYVFLLESRERLCELQLKSTVGSSIGPVLSHLFGGGVILESLLKRDYRNKSGGPVKTLGEAFNTPEFKSDFGFDVKTTATSLQEIVDEAGDESIETAFHTVSKLRNTTGHNLVWDNVFESPSSYELLVKQVVNSLLYYIDRKFT